MSKPSKGPWRSGDAFHTIFGPHNGTPLPEVIATVSRGDRANARLLAAAPELLAALEFSLAEWAQYDTANRPDGPMERARLKAIELAEAAIAKAEDGK